MCYQFVGKQQIVGDHNVDNQNVSDQFGGKISEMLETYSLASILTEKISKNVTNDSCSAFT